MSEQHHDTNETVQKTMNKYESNTDTGNSPEPQPAIYPAPDPGMDDYDDHDEANADDGSGDDVIDQVSREV